MSRRYANQGLAVLQGFQMGSGLMRDWLKDKKQAEIEAVMSGIGDAKVESDTGFTQDQGAQLDAAAKSGQYDIAYDKEKGGYVVTPKTGGETGIVAPRARHTFLGKTYDTAPSEADQDRYRLAATADVVAKYGNPLEAQRLKQQAMQTEQLRRTLADDAELRAAMTPQRDQNALMASAATDMSDLAANNTIPQSATGKVDRSISPAGVVASKGFPPVRIPDQTGR